MMNQRKHYSQMTAEEKRTIESFSHSMPKWAGLNNPHLKSKQSALNISTSDVLNTLWNGEVIEAHYNNAPDVRIVMRYKIQSRDVCVCASMRGEVITAWLNGSTDHHATLDRSQYQWKTNLVTVFNTGKVSI